MTPLKPGQKIRKVWVPAEMKAAVVEYAWRHKTRPSPLVADLIRALTESPDVVAGKAVPPAARDFISIYISDEDWERGLATAESMGTTLGAMIRVELARLLAEANIPWDVSTTRPKNEHIPSRE